MRGESGRDWCINTGRGGGLARPANVAGTSPSPSLIEHPPTGHHLHRRAHPAGNQRQSHTKLAVTFHLIFSLIQQCVLQAPQRDWPDMSIYATLAALQQKLVRELRRAGAVSETLQQQRHHWLQGGAAAADPLRTGG